MIMKKMPYRLEDGALERAKFKAKMAVREAAHPTVKSPVRRVQWQWASIVAVALVVAVGVFGLVKFSDEIFSRQTPMEKFLSKMQNASDDIIYDMAVDSGYYLEEENRL